MQKLTRRTFIELGVSATVAATVLPAFAAQPKAKLWGIRLSVSSSFGLVLLIPAFKATTIDLPFELSGFSFEPNAQGDWQNFRRD